jgi:superfamily II DNA/RNA helicase
VAQLHRSLLRHKFNAVALHGDMEQPARMAALDRFRQGEAELLIASDVAARGLDIPDVSHVFNFDVPHHPDDYVHRVGRTGRAGKSGIAITIVAPSDQKAIGAIERLTGQTLTWADGPPPDEASSSSHGESRAPRGGRGGERQRGGRGRSKTARPESRPDDSHRSEPRQEARQESHHAPRQDAQPDSRSAAKPAHKPANGPANKPAAKPASKPGRGRNEPRQPQQDEADTSHLPAFLLRPVSIKA